MRLVLIITLLSGAHSNVVLGPEEVRGLVGESLTVPCRYSAAYDDNVKYWCKKNIVSHCRTLVKSDDTPKNDRVSIIENKTERVFTVTMKDLREADKGWYQCGISVPGTFQFDQSYSVYTNVKKVQAPERMIAQVNGNITVQCKYHRSYKDHVKYWCKGNRLLPCSTVMNTGDSNTHPRISIRDDKREEAFYITMMDLSKNDEGSYMCGISKYPFDEKVSVYIEVNEGDAKHDLWGPIYVHAQASSSKTIRCQYAEVYTKSVKYWCKDSGGNGCSLEVTTEDKGREGRTQIRDDPSKREFLIIIRNLTVEDSALYYCGVKPSSSLSDKRVPVYLYVEEVNSTMSTTCKTPVELFPASTAGTTDNLTSTEKQKGSIHPTKSVPVGESSSMLSPLAISFGVLLLLCCVASVIACKIKGKARPAVAEKGGKLPESAEPTYEEVATDDVAPEPSVCLYSIVNLQQGSQRPPPADQIVYSTINY